MFRARLFWITVLILTLTTVSACSFIPRNRRGPEAPDPKKTMSILKARLRLTPEQESQVFPIIEDAAKERRAIIQRCHEDPTATAATLRIELTKLRERTEKKLAPILSEQQMNEYWKALADIEEHNTPPKGGHGPPPSGRF